MSKEEMNAALDDLGIGGDGEMMLGSDDTDEELHGREADDGAIDDPVEDDNPPGFIGYQKWVDSGKDPDDWQGKNKYSQQYDLIQNNKGFKSELRDMNDMLRQTVDATTAMQEERYQQGRAEAKEELETALANNDAQAAVAAQEKLNKPAPARATQAPVNPVHDQFFSSNAVIDQGSAEFDGEVMGEFQRIYNGRLRADGVGPSDQLSERAIKGYMKSALDGAKQLFPDKFESPRNNRRNAGSKNKRNTEQSDAVDSIKGVKIETRNPRDDNALMDTYNHILNMKGGGKEAADKFAAKMGVKS